MNLVAYINILPQGIKLLLNTGPNYGKEFLPAELNYLKKGEIPPDLTQTYQMESGQKFIIYSPKIYPTKLVDILFKRMKTCTNVEKAYLAEILNVKKNNSNYIVGIKMSNDLNFEYDIVNITEVVKMAVGPNEYVDFIQILNEDTSQIVEFMIKEIKPFYDKSYI